MVFKDTNYWGNRTQSTDAQIRPRIKQNTAVAALPDAKIDKEVIARWLESQGIPLTEINNYTQDAQRRPIPKSSVGPNTVDPTRDLWAESLKLDAQGLPLTHLRDKPTAPVSMPVDNGPQVIPGADVITGIKGLMDGVNQLSSLYAKDGAADDSPEAIYERLRKSQGQYSYTGPSAHEMASKEFDPQFALLDQIRKQTSDRYNSNKGEIANMYAGLTNDMTAARAQDAANYQKAGATVGQGYKQATDNLTGSATAYQQAMAQQLAKLGINEGTGDVVAKVGQNLQDNVGRLNAQGANTQGMLASLGANEYASDTNNIGLAQQAGLNTQAQFMQQFNDALGQNDNQRLQLTGQEGQAENQYGMQIQQLLQRGQAAQQDSLSSTLKAILDGNQQQQDNYFKQAGLDLDQSKFKWSTDPTNPANIQKQPALNPFDALSQRANSVYGDQGKARAVVDEILRQYQENPNPQSVGDFLAHIQNQDELKNDPNLTPLIYDFISKVLASQPKN